MALKGQPGWKRAEKAKLGGFHVREEGRMVCLAGSQRQQGKDPPKLWCDHSWQVESWLRLLPLALGLCGGVFVSVCLCVCVL